MAATLERKGLRGRQPVTLPKHFTPRFWDDSDGRCAVVKTILRRYQHIKADAGGSESYQRDLLCQRVAFISIILETQEVKAAEGNGEFDLGVYTQATNALTGLLKTLGLEKRIKNVSDLRTYLDQKNAK
jgi:hypothetical protein